MIIVRTPLRISFIGGGTDLASFYSNFSGAVISATINKYVYIAINKIFEEKVRLVYSSVEERASFSDFNHQIVKNVGSKLDFDKYVEIHSIADVPSQGTGLGSSSTFTVGLLNAIGAYQGIEFSSDELASMACEVEIGMCNEPIGKQDQYSAAYGGLNKFCFLKDGRVDRQPIAVTESCISQLFSNLLVFYTGRTRAAKTILKEQDELNASEKNQHVLLEMMRMIPDFQNALLKGDLKELGHILGVSWNLKKSLVSGISDTELDEIYNIALNNGAYGGKLLGAGGGGFMVFLAPPQNHERIKESLRGLRSQNWKYCSNCSEIIFNGKVKNA